MDNSKFYLCEPGTHEKLIQSFSLRKNVLALFSMSRSPGDIESIHGIRAINAVLLLIAHKCMALFFNPYLNRTVMAEVSHSEFYKSFLFVD